MRRIVSAFAVLVFMTASAPFAAAQVKDAEGFDVMYYGVDLCAKCHNEAKPPADYKIFTSRMTEVHTWLTSDKHKDATLSLQNERSKQMAKLLGIKGDLTTEKRCVSCHGVYIDLTKEANRQMIHEESYGDPEQRIKSGVSCVACHGPRIKWVQEHAAVIPKISWNKRSLTDKTHEFGMYDLVDPEARAKLCFSCHIGDAAKGRVVTHEFYAAGHPPLPGIEIATFSYAMPAHWEAMSKKIERAKAMDIEKKGKALNGIEFVKKAYEIDPSRDAMEQTRMVAMTCLTAVRSSNNLMATQAEQALKDPVAGDDRWPMLANYDCYACHHDLSSKSWRQERGYRGRPGRPEARPWSLSLARFGYDLASETSDPFAFDRAMAPWFDVFQKVPFGAPKAVVEQAKPVDALLAAKIAALRKQPFDQAEGKKALRLLVDLAGSEQYDFDSARQFAWALGTITREVDPRDARLTPIFRSLDADLQLKLPEGQVEIAPNLLDAVYGKISTYQPERFRAKMLEMNKLLKSSKN